MSKTFKLWHIKENSIEKIYVFIGSKLKEYKTDDLDKLLKTNPENNIFNDVFSPEEFAAIRENKIPILFTQQQIQIDDTIETIKKKLLKEITDIRISYEELYMFYKTLEKFNPLNVFQILTQNGKIELTKERLIQYLLNIEEFKEEKNILDIPDSLDYNDFLEIVKKIKDSKHILDKPLGQKLLALEGNYPHTVNPFNVVTFDKFLERNVSDLVTTTNQGLLMENREIMNNSIYFCLATEVLDTIIKNNLSENTAIKIYYPYLYEISNLEQLIQSKTELEIKTKTLIDDKRFLDNINNINLFYNIYYGKLKEIPYIFNGIKNINLILKPLNAFNLPLDVIFKLIHATQKVSFIQYNPGKRQENIYRLYADKIATNGKKIPYLPKGTIFRLIKNIETGKKVSVYIEHITNDEVIPLLLEFSVNGSIEISCEPLKPKNLEEINKIITESCNGVITTVKDYLSQSGYSIELFESITKTEIINMEYQVKVPIEKKIQLNNIIGCLSSVFNVVSDDIMSDNGAIMRFKRVSNYNEMDSQEAFIIEKINSGTRNVEIIQGLVDNFNLPSKEKAVDKLASFVSSLQVVQSAHEHKKLKIKNNPGFLTKIIMEKFESNVIISINGINDSSYLLTIPLYIDSLLRITQYPDTTVEINKLCKGKKQTEEEEKVEDIIAPAEKPKPDGSVFDIQGDALVFEIPEEEDTKDAMLDILLGDDDDDDDNMGEGVNKQNAGSGDDLERNITGMSLSNPNPFSDRLREREPTLFLTDNEKGFSAYSRICPWNVRRQPIILTKEEKDKIDREHPGSYDQFIQYKSSPEGTTFYYICPRYWSLKKNVSLSEEEVKTGEYGSIIPQNAKKVPAGGEIFEFSSKKHIGPDGKYQKMYPGFLKQDKHPEGKCIPCCFQYWDKPEQVKRRQQCAIEQDIPDVSREEKEEARPEKALPEKALPEEALPEEALPEEALPEEALPEEALPEEVIQEEALPEEALPEEALPEEVIQEEETLTEKKPEKEVRRPIKKTIKKKIREEQKKQEIKDEYIKGPDKFPLEPGRFGYLPIAIQKFLHTDNKKCQISPSNTNLKQNYPCVLRKGVEINKQQSFIACIAEIYSEENNNIILSIKEMKNKLIESLDLDRFIGLQNGNLVELFYSSRDEINDEKYKESKFVNSINKTEPSELHVLRKVINSYENFKKYLSDNDVFIDYHYLWDLISIPNTKLFEKGLNLAILEISDDDITENVKLICPTNSYSENNFDVNKRTVILIKSDNYYEPVLILEDKINKFVITRKYSLKFKDLLPNLRLTLETIKKYVNNSCIPLPSMPKAYEFKINISLEKLVNLLKIRRYIIENQVLNYNNKVVAVIIRKEDNERDRGYIPCYPSAPMSELSEYIWIDRVVGYKYEETRNFLTKIYKLFNGKIPCKPLIKVIDDGMIVGILTQTNQFVPIIQPEADLYGLDLKKIEDIDYTAVDKTSLTTETVDIEREKYINQIKLETNFYNIFRNTIRILIGEQKNKETRKQIEEIADSADIPYINKLKQIDLLLRDLTKNKVRFTKYDDAVLSEMSNITTCYSSENSKSLIEKCEKKSFCITTDNICALVIPKNNLISGKDNEKIYYAKVSDEIIRYSRIRSFIFEPKSYLSLSELNYNLRDDEIILLQSLLTQEYFEDLIPRIENKYIGKNNTYDTVQPLISQAYSNVVETTQKQDEILETEQCLRPTITNLTGKWSSVFPNNTKELIFPDSPPQCTFDIMVTMIQTETNETTSVSDIKEVLVAEYNRLHTKYGDNVLNILKAQGKSLVSRQVLIEQISLENMVMSNEYYLTNLDIWILSRYHKLPIILYSSTNLLENSKEYAILTTREERVPYYYFIKSPSAVIGKIPKYRLVVIENNIKIPTNILSSEIGEEINEKQQQENFVKYLKEFSITKAKKEKVVRKKLVIVGDVDVMPETKKLTKKVKKLKLVEKE